MNGIKYRLEKQRFGRLVALAYRTGGHWLCRCDCGRKTVVLSSDLRNGNTKSCGCANTRNLKHGKSTTREYRAWRNAIERCYGLDTRNHGNYAVRGITMYKEWRRNFMSFYRYIVKHFGRCPEGWTIERVDNDKGYFPGNVRWATYKEQNRNKRNNRWLTAEGKTMLLQDWADSLGVNSGELFRQLDRRGSLSKVITYLSKPK